MHTTAGYEFFKFIQILRIEINCWCYPDTDSLAYINMYQYNILYNSYKLNIIYIIYYHIKQIDILSKSRWMKMNIE